MVIQRWQTVFLVIAFGCMLAFTLCSLGQWQLQDFTYNFHTWSISLEGQAADGAQHETIWTIYLASISGLSALLPLLNIFMYRNLLRQKRVCVVTLLITIATVCACALLGYTAFDGVCVSWSLPAFAPFISIVALIFAWRGINSDYKKISNANRLWA